jgi:hypothetical protein
VQIITLAILATQAARLKQTVDATNKIANTTEEVAHRQLRAYVCHNSAVAWWEGNRPCAHMSLVNAGQTPAYDVRGWLLVMHGLGVSDDAFYPPDMPTESRGVVGPGIRVEFTRVAAAPVESQRPGGPISAWGEIHYRDAFHKPHTTGIRLYCNHPGTNETLAAGMTLYPGGNEAD